MKGSIGTPCGVISSKKLTKGYYRKGKRARNLWRPPDIAGIKKSKTVEKIVVIPPK